MAKKSAAKVPPARWLMLVHQLPAKPAYHRVKIWRQIQDTGAISLKNAVYILPAGDTARTVFADILKEIERKNGDGAIYEADLVGGMRDDQLRTLFSVARDADYHAITAELRQLSLAWKKARNPKGDPVQALARISQRLSQLGRIDFFGAQGRSAAESLLAQLEHSAIIKPIPAEPKHARIVPADMIGKTWVTRQDIHVDRIACAWLIQRFIDPAGTLKFVPTRQYQPLKGEFRYDMQDGEFTHEGEDCSFEVLLSRAMIADLALRTIAEIVHDIDLKDGKFAHPETAGIAHVISGICRTQGADEARVARGKELFDSIYEQFRRAGRARQRKVMH
jgi:hypothetical protein